MTEILSHGLFSMDSRKRKSDNFTGEPYIKRIVQEPLKPESTPKKLLRRFSTRMKILGSNFIGKNKCTGKENAISECDPDESHPMKCKDPKICTSMTYFGTNYVKKMSCGQDRTSNSSDTSRQSSISSLQIKVGIDLFNRNPKCGVEYLRSHGKEDRDLAELFIKNKAFNKRQLFNFLTDKNNRSIHECFCNLLDLKNKEIIAVLREYLKISYISGEYNAMLETVELLSKAYLNQHSEGGIMGLNITQIITIFQFLLTFNSTEPMVKNGKKLMREDFIKFLQMSLEISPINNQLASCLYYDISESPLTQPVDEKFQNLDKVCKMLVDIPKDFSLVELHRYIICHVDLTELVLSVNGSEKITSHERTVFLFNDCVIITKKHWLYDSSSYKVKQIIKLSDIKCSFIKRSMSSAIPIIQIIDCISNDLIVSFNSKLIEDSTNFYTSLEQAIKFNKNVIEYQMSYEASKSR